MQQVHSTEVDTQMSTPKWLTGTCASMKGSCVGFIRPGLLFALVWDGLRWFALVSNSCRFLRPYHQIFGWCTRQLLSGEFPPPSTLVHGPGTLTYLVALFPHFGTQHTHTQEIK